MGGKTRRQWTKTYSAERLEKHDEDLAKKPLDQETLDKLSAGGDDDWQEVLKNDKEQEHHDLFKKLKAGRPKIPAREKTKKIRVYHSNFNLLARIYDKDKREQERTP